MARTRLVLPAPGRLADKPRSRAADGAPAVRRTQPWPRRRQNWLVLRSPAMQEINSVEVQPGWRRWSATSRPGERNSAAETRHQAALTPPKPRRACCAGWRWGATGEMDIWPNMRPLRADPRRCIPVPSVSFRPPALLADAAAADTVLGDRAGLRLPLRPGPRLSQDSPSAPAETRRTDRRPSRPLQLPRLLRFGTGDGVEFARQTGTAWRGKHINAHPQVRHFLGEALHQPAAAARRADRKRIAAPAPPASTAAPRRPLSPRTSRCPALHLLPDHQLAGAIPEALRPLIGNPHLRLHDCQLCCPWNRFRHDWRPSFAPATVSMRARADRALRLDRGNLRPAPAGQPDPAHRARTLAAQHRRLALGNAPTDPAIVAALVAAPTTRRRWCASMSPGRWRNIKPGCETGFEIALAIRPRSGAIK